MKSNEQKYSYLKGLVILLSLFLLAILAGCGGGGGGGGNDDGASSDYELARNEIEKLEDVETAWKVGQYYWTHAIREKIPTVYSDEMGTLLSLESVSGELLEEKFNGEAIFGQDTSLCVFAYLIEQLYYHDAVPTLITWLETNIFSDVLLAPDCVTHALKVLTDQDDLDNVYYSYGFDEMLDALDSAINWQTSNLSQLGNSLGKTSVQDSPFPPASNLDSKCNITVEIFGKDKYGSYRDSVLKGVLWKNDFDDLGVDGEISKNNQILKDNRIYGDDKDPDWYETISDSVSRKQNCAGYVAQNVFGVEETFVSTDAGGILAASLKFGEEILDVSPETEIVAEGMVHVGVWQKGGDDGPVKHVFFIEERDDGAYIMSKDAHGFIRQKKIEYKIKDGKKVYTYPLNDDVGSMTDKQQIQYFESNLRIFKINKNNIEGYTIIINCASNNSCTAIGAGPAPNIASEVSYVQCSITEEECPIIEGTCNMSEQSSGLTLTYWLQSPPPWGGAPFPYCTDGSGNLLTGIVGGLTTAEIVSTGDWNENWNGWWDSQVLTCGYDVPAGGILICAEGVDCDQECETIEETCSATEQSSGLTLKYLLKEQPPYTGPAIPYCENNSGTLFTPTPYGLRDAEVIEKGAWNEDWNGWWDSAVLTCGYDVPAGGVLTIVE